LIDELQPVDDVARPDQAPALGMQPQRRYVGITDPASQLLELACRVDGRRWTAGSEILFHVAEEEEVPVGAALRDVVREITGAPEPAHRLRLVTPAHVEDRQQHR
jgi:hypothetical protein